MRGTVILAALTMGLGLTAIGLIPCGASQASAPAFATGALVQGQTGEPIRTIPGLQNIRNRSKHCAFCLRTWPGESALRPK